MEEGSTFDNTGFGSMPMSWMSNYGTIDPNFQNNDDSKIVSKIILYNLYFVFSNLLIKPNETTKLL